MERLKISISLVFVTCFTMMFLIVASADTVSSTSLIEESKEFDQKSIVYEGEIIGDIMKRGDYSWINVNDGSNAIGIWVHTADIEKVKYVGGYKHVGDTIRITGKFNRACLEHGGDMDIHGDTIEIIKSGYANIRPIESRRLILAATLAILAMIFWVNDKINHKKRLKT